MGHIKNCQSPCLRTTCRSWFSPIMWVQGTNSGLRIWSDALSISMALDFMFSIFH